MTNLKWRMSYETLKFNTYDGDIHKGQYAFYGGVYYIRLHPENNNQFCIIDPKEVSDAQSLIKGLKEVKVVKGEHMYYEEFILPDNRIYRIPTTKEKYQSITQKNYLPPSKEVTSQEIAEIVKDDSKWKNI